MLWVKAFHIISMVCWFAGIFYLPRLFVYHAACEDEPGRERFKIMERKLYRGITTPSMIATVFFGVWLLSYNLSGYFSQGWLFQPGLVARQTRIGGAVDRLSLLLWPLGQSVPRRSQHARPRVLPLV